MRILVLILVAASLAGCGGPAARYAAHEVPVDAGRAAAMISAYRVSRGLGPVAVDRRLNTVAAAQARANAEIGELSHDAGGSFPVRLAVLRRRRSRPRGREPRRRLRDARRDDRAVEGLGRAQQEPLDARRRPYRHRPLRRARRADEALLGAGAGRAVAGFGVAFLCKPREEARYSRFRARASSVARLFWMCSFSGSFAAARDRSSLARRRSPRSR